jgi:hypothetical protein
MQLIFSSKFCKHLSFQILCSQFMLGYLFSTLSFDQSYLSNFTVQTRYQVDLTLKQHQCGRFMVLDSIYFFFFFLLSSLIGCYLYEKKSMYVIGQACKVIEL